jgi:ABC-type metal ion transport system substrate-binding protein
MMMRNIQYCLELLTMLDLKIKLKKKTNSVKFTCIDTTRNKYKFKVINVHKHYTMQIYGGMEIKLHTFLMSALDGSE